MGGTVCDPNCVACLRAAEKKEKTRTTKRTRDWELKAEAAHEEQQHSDLIAHRIRRRWREATEGELRKACDARGVLKKGDLAGVVAQYDIARVGMQSRPPTPPCPQTSNPPALLLDLPFILSPPFALYPDAQKGNGVQVCSMPDLCWRMAACRACLRRPRRVRWLS
eukprot:Rhum_TRINITY_DN12271_c0_g1::Rhum_TRINITY_DN12271_c0_g1_i2::g.50032::m.50032